MPTDPPSIDLVTPVYDPERGTTLSHLEWAVLTVVRPLARVYGVTGAELLDLEQDAALLLARKRFPKSRANPRGFDWRRVPAGGNPDLQFRGWVHRSLPKELIRAVDKFRNGGTYNTRRKQPPGAPTMSQGVTDGGFELEVRRRAGGGLLKEFAGVPCRLYGDELVVEGSPELGDWARAVVALEDTHQKTAWHLGDLAVYGDARWPGEAWEALAPMRYSVETVRAKCRVSRRFPPGIRIPGAPWSFHHVVLPLGLDRALAVLRRAVREKMTRERLKAHIGLPRKKPPGALTRAQRARLPEVAGRHGVSADAWLAVLGELLKGAA